MRNPHSYLSLGGGVQSTALLAMMAEGYLEIQGEPAWVYEQIDWIDSQFGSMIPIHRITAGNLLENAVARSNGDVRRNASIPLWTTGQDGRAAPIRRHTGHLRVREENALPVNKNNSQQQTAVASKVFGGS